MWRILALIVALWIGAADAQTLMLTGAGSATAPSAGSCSQATTWLARTSGLSSTTSAADTTMICGMVAAGVGCSSWGISNGLDAIYVWNTDNQTTADLNMCGTSGTATVSGACLFIPDSAYFGGTSCVLDTNINVGTAGGNYTQNNNTFGLVNRSTTNNGNGGMTAGSCSPSCAFLIVGNPAANNINYTNNSNAGILHTSSPNVVSGCFPSTRASSSGSGIFQDGVLIASDTSTSASISGIGDFVWFGSTSDYSTGSVWFGGDFPDLTHLQSFCTILNTRVAATLFTPGCAASATWLASTSGLSAIERNADDAMICGMIADGNGCATWSGSSGTAIAIWILATNSTGTAYQNMCPSGPTITLGAATVTFTADQGSTGDAVGGYLNTNYTQISANLNNTSYGICVTNTRGTPAQAWTNVNSESYTGGVAVSNNYLLPEYVDGNTYVAVNSIGGSNTATVTKGMWLLSRTSSTGFNTYVNGSLLFATTDVSIALGTTTFPFILLGQYNSSTPTFFRFSGDTIAAAYLDLGINATVAAQVSARIGTRVQAVSGNNSCS